MLVFEWDESNREHIARHGVEAGEVEEALGGPTLTLGDYVLDYERRFEEVGQTMKGRILKMVITLRDERVRVITAYVASRPMRIEYLNYLKELL